MFESNSSIITEKAANNEITNGNPGSGKGTGRQNRQITLKMLRIDWIFQKTREGAMTSYGNLVSCLANANDSLFATELVKTLVMNFWDDYSKMVIKFVLVPFIIYFCSTVMYFSTDLINEDFRKAEHNFDNWLPTEENDYSFEFINRVITIVFMVYFFLWECVQIKRNGAAYFQDPWNYLDMISISLNTFLLIDLFLMKDKILSQEDTVLAAFVSVLILWWKLIYWFRLFATTSFYIKLIVETIRGIGYFTIIFIFIIGAFANAIYILDANRVAGTEESDGSMMLGGEIENRAFDALLNQYMLALGEFQSDAFSADGAPNSQIIWILFVITTFLSQITVLNMLIAIMGDTFDAVLEKQEQYAMKEKISILNDFVSIVEFFSDKTNVKKFIYVAEPKNRGDDEGGSWDGKIGAIKKGIQSSLDDQKIVFTKKMDLVKSEITQSS